MSCIILSSLLAGGLATAGVVDWVSTDGGIFRVAETEPSSGVVEKAKFKAWSDRKGISADDAKKQYIDLAQQWQGKYA